MPVITLQIKAVETGVRAAVSGITAALQQQAEAVSAFNQRIQNGSRVLNQALQPLAALFGAQQLRSLIHQAEEAVVAEAKLAQALRAAGQAAAGSWEDFSRQAQALETLTGVQNDTILNVQRLLLQLGATGVQVRELTPLVLDVAAAMGTTAETAARQLGQALDGSGLAIGRFNLQAKDIPELIESLRARFSGQAQAAHAARGRMGEFEVAVNQVREALGRLLLSPVGGFLKGLTGSIRATTESVERFQQQNPQAAATLGSLGEASVKVAAPLALVGLAVLGVQGVLRLLSPVITLARTALYALTGGFNDYTRAFGAVAAVTANFKMLTLGTASAASKAAAALQLLGSAAAVVGAVLAGWQLGRIISEIELGGLKIGEWAQLIFHEWTGWFDKLLLYIKSWWALAREHFGENMGRLKLIVMAGVLTIAEWWNKIPGAPKVDTTGLEQSLVAAEEKLRQHAINRELILTRRAADFAAIDAATTQNIGDVVNATGQRNAPTAAPPPPPAPPPAAPPPPAALKVENLEATRAELALMEAEAKASYDRRETDLAQFLAVRRDLATRAMELELAASDGNADAQAAVWFKFQQTLLDIEEDGRRERDRRAKEAQEQQLDALQHATNRELQAIKREQALLDADFRRTDADKRAERLALMDREIAAQEKLLEQLRAILALTQDEAGRRDVQGRIQSAEEELGNLRGYRAGAGATADPLSFVDQIDAKMTSLFERWGTAAQSIADLFVNTIGAAVDSVTNELTNAIVTTGNWGQALRNIYTNVLNSLVSGFIRFFAQRIVMDNLYTALSITNTRLRGAAEKREGLQSAWTAAVKAGKSVAEIPYVGWALAPAVFAGVLAALIAASSIGGFAKGGRPPVGKVSVVGEEGPELFVPDQPGTIIPNNKLAAFLDNLRVGALTTMSLAPALAANVNPVTPAAGFGRATTSFNPTINAQPGPTSFIIVNSIEEAMRAMEGRLGERVVMMHFHNNKLELGLPS